MNLDFFAPFDWAGSVMIDFGIFLNEFSEKTVMTDVFVALFVVILLAPYALKVLKEKPLKKLLFFLNQKNNGIVVLALSCFILLGTVALDRHGFHGLVPFCSIGGLTLVTAAVFI